MTEMTNKTGSPFSKVMITVVKSRGLCDILAERQRPQQLKRGVVTDVMSAYLERKNMLKHLKYYSSNQCLWSLFKLRLSDTGLVSKKLSEEPSKQRLHPTLHLPRSSINRPAKSGLVLHE